MNSIAEEYINASAKSLAADIDFEILTILMIESGWTKVVLKPMTMETGTEIDQWVDNNCKSPHMTRGLVWVFKNPKDAMWFRMRWYG